MDRKQSFREAYPHFFFLDPSDAAGLEAYLRESTIITASERVTAAEKAGEGNMNCTVRVRTGERSLILKQSRPWVEKYPQIDAPWDRALAEARFYSIVAGYPAIAAHMPRIIRVDPAARLICMEDLGSAQDFTSMYSGGSISHEELRTLIGVLRVLHDSFRGQAESSELANRDMRALNHQHIFVIPLKLDNGLDLDRITPGLTDAARTLQSDAQYADVVGMLGNEYLADGACLLHGDYFPGSWLRTSRGVKVIDPEFGFFGPPEFDLGVLIAHLHLARKPELAQIAFELYGTDSIRPHDVEKFAGVEIMRRLIGVAQLPVTLTIEEKRELLTLSRRMVVSN